MQADDLLLLKFTGPGKEELRVSHNIPDCSRMKDNSIKVFLRFLCPCLCFNLSQFYKAGLKNCACYNGKNDKKGKSHEYHSTF